MISEDVGDNFAGDEKVPSQRHSTSAPKPGISDTLRSSTPDKESLNELMKNTSIADLLTGLAPTGKNKKDMADYKFWSTQPVSRFDEAIELDGPIEAPAEFVSTDEVGLLRDFQWVNMNLDDDSELKEVYELLSANYVEDEDAIFRFDYSASFLRWALKSPHYNKDWHIGVRVKATKRLVAFISGIPLTLRARAHDISCSEINFLCIHKKLRSKRLAPVLIKEVTRRCHLSGIWQAVYTAGIVLPKPVSSCRYYHRSLNWLKLYEIGFSPLPRTSTKTRQIQKYKLPEKTVTKGLRPMLKKDLSSVTNLLQRFLARFKLHQVFTESEVDHWLLCDDKSQFYPERVVWTYVTEDSSSGKITDFVSFYSLPSSVIGNSKHTKLNAAYLFYYGTETAFSGSASVYQKRLCELMNDALILAKDVSDWCCAEEMLTDSLHLMFSML